MDLTTVDKLLTTTRSVRKRLDLTRPVEREVIERCIEISLQDPTGSNVQGWHFMVVTEAEKRAALADLYRKGIKAYADIQVKQPPRFGEEDLRTAQRPRVRGSSGYLGEHLHEVPAFVIPCIEVRMKEVPELYGFSEHKAFYQATIYGSVLPAAWSLMLALRARGLGSAWTDATPNLRERSCRHPRTSRSRNAGGPAPRCLLQRGGFQTGRAPSRLGPDPLECLGAPAVGLTGPSPS